MRPAQALAGPAGLRIRRAAAGHQEVRGGHDAARAEAFDPHGGKRRHQSQQQEARGQCRGNLFRGLAEFIAQWA